MRKIFYPILAAVFIFSCKPEEATPKGTTINPPSTQSTQDNNRIENEFEDVETIVKLALEANNLGHTGSNLRVGAVDNCYSATLDSESKTLTLLFDTTVECLDQKIRSGKIIINYTDRYINENSVITTTFDKYTVNGNKLEGVRKVTNQGKNTNDDLTFKIEVSNGKLTKVNGEISEWACTRYQTWTEGDSTPLNGLDDFFEIYGDANGVDTKGGKYTVKVDAKTPLVYDMECWYTHRLPIKGIFEITPEGEDVRKIDYGTGACDYSFTLIYKGFSFPVTVSQ